MTLCFQVSCAAILDFIMAVWEGAGGSSLTCLMFDAIGRSRVPMMSGLSSTQEKRRTWKHARIGNPLWGFLPNLRAGGALISCRSLMSKSSPNPCKAVVGSRVHCKSACLRLYHQQRGLHVVHNNDPWLQPNPALTSATPSPPSL